MSESLYQQYIETGDSGPLVDAFKPFLMKFHYMFACENIDFDNKNIREFLHLFVADDKMKSLILKTTQYHSTKLKNYCYQAIRYMKRNLSCYDTGTKYGCNHHQNLERCEIYHELLIPFLLLLDKYDPARATFEGYIEACYKFRLKDYLCEKMEKSQNDTIQYCESMNDKGMAIPEMQIVEEQSLTHHLKMKTDEQDPLYNNQAWIDGDIGSEYFKEMWRKDRIILTQYYEQGKSDLEIAQHTGFSYDYIRQRRRRLVQDLREMRVRGEIKCLR